MLKQTDAKYLANLSNMYNPRKIRKKIHFNYISQDQLISNPKLNFKINLLFCIG